MVDDEKRMSKLRARRDYDVLVQPDDGDTCVGTVVAVGSGVRNLHPRDRVTFPFHESYKIGPYRRIENWGVTEDKSIADLFNRTAPPAPRTVGDFRGEMKSMIALMSGSLGRGIALGVFGGALFRLAWSDLLGMEAYLAQQRASWLTGFANVVQYVAVGLVVCALLVSEGRTRERLSKATLQALKEGS